jgi:hypothetical protein
MRKKVVLTRKQDSVPPRSEPLSEFQTETAEARVLWNDRKALLDPAKLVFIDETGTSTNMARRYGRAKRGRRVIGRVP